MKKIFISLLVLTMASRAGASLQISVNGDLNPSDSEIVVFPGGELILGIWTDSTIPFGTGNYWALVVNMDAAYIDPSSGVVCVDDPGFFIERFYGIYDMLPGLPPGLNGLCGGALDSEPPDTVAGTVLFDQILYQFLSSYPDAILSLYETDGVTMNLVDTVIVHNVPEPMTIGLLGLGALFLRRRK